MGDCPFHLIRRRRCDTPRLWLVPGELREGDSGSAASLGALPEKGPRIWLAWMVRRQTGPQKISPVGYRIDDDLAAASRKACVDSGHQHMISVCQVAEKRGGKGVAGVPVLRVDASNSDSLSPSAAIVSE